MEPRKAVKIALWSTIAVVLMMLAVLPLVPKILNTIDLPEAAPELVVENGEAKLRMQGLAQGWDGYALVWLGDGVLRVGSVDHTSPVDLGAYPYQESGLRLCIVSGEPTDLQVLHDRDEWRLDASLIPRCTAALNGN